MPFSLLPSFLSYCFINGITPGPANLCSLSTAMNEGKQAALHQWTGLFTGFALVSLGSVLITAFLGNILGERVRFLAWIGAGYLLWMAWSLLCPVIFPAGEKEPHNGRTIGRATFWTGLLIQLTNVKIMVFCMTALASYVLPYTHSFLSLLLVGFFLPFTGPVCNLAWLFTGVKLQRLFQQYKKTISILMAISLVYCAVSLVL
ncbi:MAG: LysE family transporter [Victivallales bacterium]|nr:LysE family transporter [Victivallales bacterium]